MQNGRKCHDCQRHIGHVIQKRAKEGTFYVLSDQCHWQCPDRIQRECRHNQIKINILCQLSALPSCSVSFSRTGNFHAAKPAITTVSIMILKPSEISLIPGIRENRKLASMEKITIPHMILLFFAGGMIMAINIP